MLLKIFRICTRLFLKSSQNIAIFYINNLGQIHDFEIEIFKPSLIIFQSSDFFIFFVEACFFTLLSLPTPPMFESQLNNECVFVYGFVDFYVDTSLVGNLSTLNVFSLYSFRKYVISPDPSRFLPFQIFVRILPNSQDYVKLDFAPVFSL